jgi:hypothetical protein
MMGRVDRNVTSRIAIAIYLVLILSLIACARRQRSGTSYKRDSAPSQTAHRAEARHSVGDVPCRAEDITISNTNYGSKDWRGGVWQWDATCRSKTYFCSSHLPGRGWAKNETWSVAKCTRVDEDEEIEPSPSKARTSTTGREGGP